MNFVYTQQDLANGLCLILTTLGIILSSLAMFDSPLIHKQEAKELGDKYFTTGITLGFGVGAVNRIVDRRKRKKDESVESDEEMERY